MRCLACNNILDDEDFLIDEGKLCKECLCCSRSSDYSPFNGDSYDNDYTDN